MGFAANPINKYFFKPLEKVDTAVNTVSKAVVGVPVVGKENSHMVVQQQLAANAEAAGMPFQPTAYNDPAARPSTPENVATYLASQPAPAPASQSIATPTAAMPMQEAVKDHITLVGENSELAQAQKRARGTGAAGIVIPPVGGAPGPGVSSAGSLA